MKALDTEYKGTILSRGFNNDIDEIDSGIDE